MRLHSICKWIYVRVNKWLTLCVCEWCSCWWWRWWRQWWQWQWWWWRQRQQQQRGRNSHLDFNKYDYSTYSICASFKCDNLVNIVSSLSGLFAVVAVGTYMEMNYFLMWSICGANVEYWKWSKSFYMEAGSCGSRWILNEKYVRLAISSHN